MPQYELLQALPTYGPMYIPVTEDGRPYYSEGVPVRLYKSDGTDWVANFAPGNTRLKQVIPAAKSPYLIVLALGTCYIMHPDHPKPVAMFGGDLGHVVWASKQRLVLSGSTSLTIIEPDLSFWETEPISWDGIEEVKAEQHVVKGLSYNPMATSDAWVEFAYDLDTQTLTGGSLHFY